MANINSGPGLSYAEARGLVSGEDFEQAMNKLITAYGGTPTEVPLGPDVVRSDASYKHLITYELFAGKMNQLIQAMGGTPSPVEDVGNAYAKQAHLISSDLFVTKIMDVKDNASGGADYPCTIAIKNNTSSAFPVYSYAETGEYTGRFIAAGETADFAMPKATSAGKYYCPNGLLYIFTSNTLTFVASSTYVGTKAFYGQVNTRSGSMRGYVIGIDGCETGAQLNKVTFTVTAAS